MKDAHGHGRDASQLVKAGQRFGLLTVIDPEVRKPVPSVPAGLRAALCRCDCGSETVVTITWLVRGAESCGCERRRRLSERLRSHGLNGHPLFDMHRAMMQRCYRRGHHAYPNYGARGIQVCQQWHDPHEFISWIEQNLGARPDGMTLDRIDNDGNYEPGNVRWATKTEQALNRRPRGHGRSSSSPLPQL